MKIKCTDCGKKYKDMYMQCPHCGAVRREVTVHTNTQEMINKEDLYGQSEKETSIKSKCRPQKSVERKWQKETEQKRIRVGLCIGIGVSVVAISRLYTWGVNGYREKMNPKEIQIQQINIGDTLETPYTYVQVKGASIIENEWLANYIPEGYQMVAVEVEGREKEKRDESTYDTTYYVSYEKDGKIYDQPNLIDSRVVDSLSEHGYNLVHENYEFYLEEPVYVTFLVHKGVKQITFNYTQLLYGQLRGFYKGITYEIPLYIKGEK